MAHGKQTPRTAMAGDEATFLAALHHDVMLHEPTYLPYGGEFQGRDGFIQVLTEAAKFLDVAGIEVLSATADEDRTMLLMTIPVLATGERVHVTEHWQMRDRQVIDVRVFWFFVPEFG